ncbi:MAG: hypothetical protein PUJ66_01995 [Faecalibacterium sp.]|jgi:protein-arginine kinase activator protein McsA|nr:hypothetical protein [Faecalibacterium sp.]CCY04623.1 uvrB/UvrC domain protein [Faecalibacterium sp. CAG:1138]
MGYFDLPRFCDVCGAHPASVKRYVVFEDGRIAELAVCAYCAMSDRNLLTADELEAILPQEDCCPTCHTPLSKIQKSLYVGCADCYDHFRAQILKNVVECQGRRKHIGKRPGGKRNG